MTKQQTIARHAPTHKSKTTRRSPVCPFVKKLFRMVCSPTNDHIIKWSDDGTQVIIVNRESLVNECLPMYHMPANFHHFNRLLLHYQFKKVCSSRKAKSVTYVHPFFQRGSLHKLKLIKRGESAHVVRPLCT